MLRVYTIGVLAGDSACLTAQEQTGIAAVATYPVALTNQTGGLAESICASDFSAPLNAIGADLKAAASTTVTLAHTPIAGSVTVTFSPSQTIQWTISGNVITFAAGIPNGTQINVSYKY
jgi:hypothetical protein